MNRPEQGLECTLQLNTGQVGTDAEVGAIAVRKLRVHA